MPRGKDVKAGLSEASPILGSTEDNAAVLVKSRSKSGGCVLTESDCQMFSKYGIIALVMGCHTLACYFGVVQTLALAERSFFPDKNFAVLVQLWQSRAMAVVLCFTLIYPRFDVVGGTRLAFMVLGGTALCYALGMLTLQDSFGAYFCVACATVISGFGSFSISSVLGLLSRLSPRFSGHAGIGIAASGVISSLYTWPLQKLAPPRTQVLVIMTICITQCAASLGLLRMLSHDPVVKPLVLRQYDSAVVSSSSGDVEIASGLSGKSAGRKTVLQIFAASWSTMLSSFLSTAVLFIFYPAMVIRMHPSETVTSVLVGLQNVGELIGRGASSGGLVLTPWIGLFFAVARFAAPCWAAAVLRAPYGSLLRSPCPLCIVMLLQSFFYGLVINSAFIRAPDFFELAAEKQTAGVLVGSMTTGGILFGTVAMQFALYMGFFPSPSPSNGS